MSESHHDELFKETFSNPKHAAVELRAVLPPELLKQIDLDALKLAPEQTIGKDLSVRHCDIVYVTNIAGMKGYIYLLLEHQSTVDRLMAFRILEYVVRLIARHLEMAGNKLPLPPIIPIVVHHSEGGWTAATEVQDLFPEQLTSQPAIARYLPKLSFILDDLSQASDKELQARAVAEAEKVVPLVLWAFRDSRNKERLLASVVAWQGVLSQVYSSPTGKDALSVSLLRFRACMKPSRLRILSVS